MSMVQLSGRGRMLMAARPLASGSRAYSSAIAARPRNGVMSPLVRSVRPNPLYAASGAIGVSRSISVWPFSSSSPAPSPPLQQRSVVQSVDAKRATASQTEVAPSPDAVAAGQAAPVQGAQDSILNQGSDLAGISGGDSVQHAMAAASEHVATLESLGKLSSWPNVHYAQQMLDWVVETTGLPWWATIAVVTVSIRVAVFPIVVKGQANAIRLANINPEMQRHMADITSAKKEGNMLVMSEATQKVQKLMKDNNCNPLKSFITPLVQAPLFMTLFFALKGLAGAGLASMHTGGLLWFKDISIADPTAILPVVAAGLTLATLETGAEMGAGLGPKTQQQLIMRNVLRGICFIMIPITWSLPAAVFCYWATNNVFSLLQLLFLQQPGVRRWLKLPAKKDRSLEDENDPFKPPKESYLSKLRALNAAPAPAPVPNTAGATNGGRRGSAAQYSATNMRAADREKEANRNRALKRFAAGNAGREDGSTVAASNASESAALTEDPIVMRAKTTTAAPTGSTAEEDDPYAATLEEQLEREQERKNEEKRQRVAAARQRKLKKRSV